MEYLISPSIIVSNAEKKIKGFTNLTQEHNVPPSTILDLATDVVESWSMDWDPNEGFGSSDLTFVLKDFIDHVIGCYTPGKYKTIFNPTLEVVGVVE